MSTTVLFLLFSVALPSEASRRWDCASSSIFSRDFEELLIGDRLYNVSAVYGRTRPNI